MAVKEALHGTELSELLLHSHTLSHRNQDMLVDDDHHHQADEKWFSLFGSHSESILKLLMSIMIQD